MPSGGNWVEFKGWGSMFLFQANHFKGTEKVGSLWSQDKGQWLRKVWALCTLFVPITRIRVLAVMLVTTLVATHSHSPWSSLLRDTNCKLPLGKMLCLLLLGFPTLNGNGHCGNMVKQCWAICKSAKVRRWSDYLTFLQVMVGISGSPEAAQGITSSLPASWRYSPPGLTLK